MFLWSGTNPYFTCFSIVLTILFTTSLVTGYSEMIVSIIFSFLFLFFIISAIFFRNFPTSWATSKGTGINSPSHAGIAARMFSSGSTRIFRSLMSRILQAWPFTTKETPSLPWSAMNSASSVPTGLFVTTSIIL